MSSSPYILGDQDSEAYVLERKDANPPEDAPEGDIVLELNDGEAIAQLYMDPTGAKRLAQRLLWLAEGA